MDGSHLRVTTAAPTSSDRIQTHPSLPRPFANQHNARSSNAMSGSYIYRVSDPLPGRESFRLFPGPTFIYPDFLRRRRLSRNVAHVASQVIAEGNCICFLPGHKQTHGLQHPVMQAQTAFSARRDLTVSVAGGFVVSPSHAAMQPKPSLATWKEKRDDQPLKQTGRSSP